MTSIRPAEKEELNLKCPNCESQQLDIYLNEAILNYNGDFFEISLEGCMWDDLSDCECYSCKYIAQVKEFKEPPP